MKRFLSRTSVVLAASGLAASLLAAPTQATRSAAARVDNQTPGAVLSSQTWSFGPAHRMPGMPTSSAPHEQLAQVSVERSLYVDHDWVTVRTTLGAAPEDASQRVYVFIGLGHREENTCNVKAQRATRTTVGARTDEYLYYLGERDYNSRMGPRPDRPYTCGVAWIERSDSAAEIDAMIGSPVNHYKAPRLKVGKVTLLGAKQKKLKMVKGVWTPYSVEVKNTGTSAVSALTVTGKGKGLKVRKARSSVELRPGKTATLRLQVRHTGKQKKPRLKVTATAAGGTKASRTIRVVRTKAPRKATNGRYVGAGGRVKFRIKNGRIVNFSATTTTRCEASRDTENTYSFPKVKIPRHGVVVASRDGKASGARWATHLSLRAVGTKVTRGHFNYNIHTPGLLGSNCSAGEGFSARRVGK